MKKIPSESALPSAAAVFSSIIVSTKANAPTMILWDSPSLSLKRITCGAGRQGGVGKAKRESMEAAKTLKLMDYFTIDVVVDP